MTVKKVQTENWIDGTVVAILVIGYLIGWLVVVSGIIFTAIHFIHKFW